MKTFIVAIPLFDASMTVDAYWLRAQSGEKMLASGNDFRSKNDEWLNPGLDLLEKVGVEPFAADKRLFVDINRYQLLMGAPANRSLPADRLVSVIPGGLPRDDELLEKCRELQRKGYVIAIHNFPLSGLSSPYFDYADYLILNPKDPRYAEIAKAMAANLRHVRLVVQDIPDTAAFNAARGNASTKGALFSGQFYSKPVTSGSGNISPLKVNVLNLLKNVNTPDFDLRDIARIIERDPALSISLLRFINSSLAGQKRKVDSIMGAVAIMGQEEIRRWAAVAIQINLAEERPGEVTRLSLIRGQFAENLAGAFELGVFQNSLFITGLFSLLDVILERPMIEAMQDVAVDQKVYDALVNRRGPLSPVMDIIYAYERADWDQVAILMIRNNTNIEAVSTAFVDALVWYNRLLSSIDAQAGEAGESYSYGE